MRKHYAPRIFKDRKEDRWKGRCTACFLTLSADHWSTVVDDVLIHVANPVHAGQVALTRKALEER